LYGGGIWVSLNIAEDVEGFDPFVQVGELLLIIFNADCFQHGE